MPSRTTVAMAQASRLGIMINVDPVGDFPRFLQYLNESCERLLKRGKFWGTYSTWNTALTSRFFSLPPYLDTVEAIALGGGIIPIHDMLYAYLDNGWGARDQTSVNGSGVNECLQVGQFPTFVDVIPPGSTSTGSQLTIRCDVAADVGQPVLLLGYDNATPPNWIRTQVAGVWQDGEIVLMAQGAGTASVNTFSKLTAIQLGTVGTPLNGQSWIYAGTVASGTLLSNYQWFEFSPSYQRWLVPWVNSTVSTIQVIGKNAFIPCAKTTDFLSVGNLAAVKLGCRAIKAEEESSWVEANLLWNGGQDAKTKQQVTGAIQELNFELAHHLGDGRHIGINFTGSGYGNDPVYPIV